MVKNRYINIERQERKSNRVVVTKPVYKTKISSHNLKDSSIHRKKESEGGRAEIQNSDVESGPSNEIFYVNISQVQSVRRKQTETKMQNGNSICPDQKEKIDSSLQASDKPYHKYILKMEVGTGMISKHTRSNLVEMMDDCKEEAREHLDEEDISEQCNYFKEGLHNEVNLLGETQKTNIDQNVIENG